jgi:hypothetical protein
MTDSANITRLQRKPVPAKERQAKYRRHKAAAKAAAAALAAVTSAAPVISSASVAPIVTAAGRQSARNVTRTVNAGVTPAMRRLRDGASVTLAAALGIASVSAFFSVTGLTHVFRGAFWPVIAMGCMLECAKLASIGWLARRHGSAPLRIVMVGLVMVLMVLSAVGSYGYLSFAHIARVASTRLRSMAALPRSRLRPRSRPTF